MNRRVLSKTLGAKALAIHSLPEGGTVTTHTEEARRRQALPDTAILELAHLGQQVADLYGAPQDIEWAWANDRLSLLQARPITSLFPTPAIVNSGLLDIFFSVGAVQGVLDPLTPLGRDNLILVIAAGLGRAFGLSNTLKSQTVFHTAGERLWARVTPLTSNRIGRRVIQTFAGLADPGIQQALAGVLAETGHTALGWPRPATLRHIAHFVRKVLPTMLHSLLWPEQGRVAIQRQLEEAVDRFAAQSASADTLLARLALLEEKIPPLVSRVFPGVLARVLPGMLMLNRLLALANQVWAGDKTQQQRALEITRGLPHNVTTEMDLALWSTAQEIRGNSDALAYMQDHDASLLAQSYGDGRLPAAAQHAVDAFLQRYGMRGVAEIDMGRPRWRENPVQVMQTLQSYLRIKDDAQAPVAVFRRGEEAARRVIGDLQAAVRPLPLGAGRAWLVAWMAQRFRALAGLRESPKFFMIRLFGIVRLGLLQSGQELAQQGVLERPDDIFFLHLDELKGLSAGYAIDWKALVAVRRANYEREHLRRQIPRLLLSDGRAFYRGVDRPSADRAGVLVGAPVSPGVVEGTVRVVFDPHTTQLAPGEILVCPGTDPAWTPLFLAAGGLVMEVGGLMTHGSVVAREYGIPAVVGVHEATSRLQTGQRVRVDGSSGEVTRLSDS
jgi:pyruvate,water dikinase